MANHLLDTSGLVKYYHMEKGTPQAQAIIDDPANAVFISNLSVIEIHSSFAKKVRTGEITVQQFRLFTKRFSDDVKLKKYRIVRLTEVHFSQATRLILKHGLRRALRTLDALQLAVALSLKARGMLDASVTADDKFIGVARREAIRAINPEKP